MLWKERRLKKSTRKTAVQYYWVCLTDYLINMFQNAARPRFSMLHQSDKKHYCFTLIEQLKSPVKFPWILNNLSVNFPWNSACFEKAPVKFCIFLRKLGWSLVIDITELTRRRLSLSTVHCEWPPEPSKQRCRQTTSLYFSPSTHDSCRSPRSWRRRWLLSAHCKQALCRFTEHCVVLSSHYTQALCRFTKHCVVLPSTVLFYHHTTHRHCVIVPSTVSFYQTLCHFTKHCFILSTHHRQALCHFTKHCVILSAY